MFLKEVVFNGFKSFADKTRIALDPGVTCIVGPNGCGKSNIVDAIRWVLGEQSAKALRGGKMQDVIFAGTDKRKPLQLCEVSLLFSDCEKELGSAFNEVEITRRVSREGSSDYFLNGNSCRLKDIQQLFMDTGIGRVSYSFMVQGQIDQILSSNPAERRTIFEEAAGITKYKSQRKEALNKLALVDQNLSRVTDVIEEVNTRIVSLKRQASKALRYKHVKHRLSQLDLAFNSHHYKTHSDKILFLEKEAHSLKEKVHNGEFKLRDNESQLEDKKLKRGSLYHQLQEIQQKVFDLRSEKEQAQSQSEFATVRSQDLTDRLAGLAQENEALEKQYLELKSRSEEDLQSKQLHMNLFGSSDEHFKIRARELESIDNRLHTSENSLNELRSNIYTTETKITRLRSQNTTLEVELKTSDIHKNTLGESIYQAKEEHIQVENQLNESINVLKIRIEEKTKLESNLGASQVRLKEIQNTFRETQKEIQAADRQIAHKQTQLSLLEELEAKFEGFSEGAKAIFQGKISDTLSSDKSQLVTQNITIDPQAISTVERLLGAAVDAITIQDISKIKTIAQTIQDKKIGATCLQIPLSSHSKNNKKIPACLKPIQDFIKINNSEFQELSNNLFNNCYLCEDLDTFISFWQSNPDFHFSFIITNDGELIDPRGLIFLGRPLNQKSKSSFIQRKNEKKKLIDAINTEENTLSEFQEKAHKLQDQIDEQEEIEEENRQRISELSQEISILNSEQSNYKNNIERFNQSINRNENELDSLTQRYDVTEKKLSQITHELSEAELELEAQRQKISHTEEFINAIRKEREDFRESLSEVKLELSEKKQQLELIDQSLTMIQQEQTRIQEKIAQNKSNVESIHSQVGILKEQSAEQKNKATEIETTLQSNMASLQENKKVLMRFESEIKEIEDHLHEQRSAHHSFETQLNAHEVSLAKECSQKEFITEKIRTQYEINIDSIDWKQSLWEAENAVKIKLDFDDIDSVIDHSDLEIKIKDPSQSDLEALDATNWSLIKNEIDLLKSRISSMGAVNLVAIEEYKELKDRYDFLKSQSDDLWNSKEQLVNAIDQINETSKQLFQETFEKVKNEFQIYIP